MRRQAKKTLQIGNQQGIASILLTLVMAIVLMIIVLGFATASRREQRQALDEQLSTAAFYAAESGINDAHEAIGNLLAANPTFALKTKSNCATDPNYPTLTNNTIDQNPKVVISCLLINPQPTVLQYFPLEAGPHTIPLNAGSDTSPTFGKLTITWALPIDIANTVTAGVDPLAGCPASASVSNFPVGWPNSCLLGALRIDLVPIPTGSLTVNSLMQNDTSAFLIPTSTLNTSVVLALGSQGSIIPGNCQSGLGRADASCSVQIGNNNFPAGTNYALRVEYLYRQVNLSISAKDTSGNAMELNGAQVLIDSTGEASDVQRRIQARISTTSPEQPSVGGAIQTTNILCKRFIITPSGIAASSDNPNPGEPSSFPFGATTCDLPPLAPVGGGEGGGLGIPTGSGPPPAASENAFVSYYNDASQGYPTTSVPTSCTIDWGDGTPSAPDIQAITIAQCRSYNSSVQGGLNQVSHNYCNNVTTYGYSPSPGGVDCMQGPSSTPAQASCPPGPGGAPTENVPYANFKGFKIVLTINDANGGAVITQWTPNFPVCNS